MSGPEFISTLRSTDHDFTAGLRFLEEYAKHLNSRNIYSSDDVGRRFVPRFDLEEHEQSYELYGELPGFDKDHIIVEANDDRNIQISGWIPRKHHGDHAASSNIASPGTDITDPSVKVEHHDVPQEEHHVSTERFGEVLNPHREPLSSAPVVSQSLDARESSPAVHQTTHEHKPEMARFGDVLNPQASFVHKPKDGASGRPKVRYLVAERQFGQFHRTFHFPSPIKKDEVSARIDNGILHISAPRAAVPPPTKIEIKKGPHST
jgi:HSP20 family molecular chaperone IbpA